jgi:hypothetical protein
MSSYLYWLLELCLHDLGLRKVMPMLLLMKYVCDVMNLN